MCGCVLSLTDCSAEKIDDIMQIRSSGMLFFNDATDLSELQCREGKNRMIRRICDHLRLRVSRLRRIAFGPFSLRKHLPDRFAVVEARVPASLRRLIDDER